MGEIIAVRGDLCPARFNESRRWALGVCAFLLIGPPMLVIDFAANVVRRIELVGSAMGIGRRLSSRDPLARTPAERLPVKIATRWARLQAGDEGLHLGADLAILGRQPAQAARRQPRSAEAPVRHSLPNVQLGSYAGGPELAVQAHRVRQE